MTNRVNFSKRQQAFNAKLLISVPELLDDQMQFFISWGQALPDFLKKLPLLFWSTNWYLYYRFRWEIDRDEMGFLLDLEEPKYFKYLLVVHESVTLDSIYQKIFSDQKISLDLSLSTGNKPTDIFKFKRRDEETYAIWHKHSNDLISANFEAEEIQGIHNELYGKSMDLLEILIWFDFVTFMKFTSERVFNTLSFGENEITRCIGTLSFKDDYYASVIIKNNICRIVESRYFGGNQKRVSFEDKAIDYVREIIF